MNMFLNSTFVKNIRDYGISPDLAGTAIFILISLDKENYEVLDALDDNNKDQRIAMLYQTLNRKGFLEKAQEDDKFHYGITEKGYDFLNYIYAEIGNNVVTPTTEVDVAESINKIRSESPEDWIGEYLSIFPSGKIEGKTLRLSSAETLPKMKSFLKKYHFTKEDILTATRLYMKEERGGQQHTRNSKYFIEKQDKEKGYISDLLTYCERLQQEQQNPQPTALDLDVL